MGRGPGWRVGRARPGGGPAATAGPLHLLLDQFPVGVLAACGEELFAVAHLEAALHAESLAVGVALQHQKRRVGRDDVVLFRQGDDLVFNGRRTALLQSASRCMRAQSRGMNELPSSASSPCLFTGLVKAVTNLAAKYELVSPAWVPVTIRRLGPGL